MNKEHIISLSLSVKEVLKRLDKLASDAILFLVNDENKLIGSITDGDIRRGLIKGLTLDTPILDFTQSNPKAFVKGKFSLEKMKEWRENHYRIIPVIDENKHIVDIINFRLQKSYLPIEAVIMAGGRGKRLMPLTENTPKPLIEVGGKPIVSYNIDRLASFGVRDLHLTVNYLGEQIKERFGSSNDRGLSISYTTESKPMGTMGALGLIDEFSQDVLIVMNSDLLTDVDFEDMYAELVAQDADMAVATTTHEVQIPYGIIESDANGVIDIKEKPTYTYHSNAGIYMFKKELLDIIPVDEYFDATDFIKAVLKKNKKVVDYAILGYWLDIGKHQDLEKANRDIKHLKL